MYTVVRLFYIIVAVTLRQIPAHEFSEVAYIQLRHILQAGTLRRHTIHLSMLQRGLYNRKYKCTLILVALSGVSCAGKHAPASLHYVLSLYKRSIGYFIIFSILSAGFGILHMYSIHTVIWCYAVAYVVVSVAKHQAVIIIHMDSHRFMVLHAAIYKTAQLHVSIHVLYRDPTLLCPDLCIFGIAPDRVYESIVRRLHGTHFIRCVVCGCNTALPNTCSLECKVYCLERRSTIQVLCQVTIIEHTGDMRLQHIRPDEVQITFIGSLPQDTTGKLALVALDVFGEVFSRSIEALIRQGVLSGRLFLASGNAQQTGRSAQHQLRSYPICLYANGALIHFRVKAHLAHPISCGSTRLLWSLYVLLAECTYCLCT